VVPFFTFGDTAMLLLFSLFALLIAALSFFVAFVSLHIWLIASFITCLVENKFFRATLWACAIELLIRFDISAWG
jgi:hypothetical protein